MTRVYTPHRAGEGIMYNLTQENAWYKAQGQEMLCFLAGIPEGRICFPEPISCELKQVVAQHMMLLWPAYVWWPLYG